MLHACFFFLSLPFDACHAGYTVMCKDEIAFYWRGQGAIDPELN